MTVESTRRERDTLALPFTVDRVTAESDTVLPPLTVLLIRVERPLRFACPFTTDPLRILVGPETVARPQMAESRETYTEASTEAVLATVPPPFS